MKKLLFVVFFLTGFSFVSQSLAATTTEVFKFTGATSSWTAPALENNCFVVTNVLDVSSEKDLGAPLDDFVLNVRFTEDASAQADKRPLVCDMVRIEADGASYDINASASSSAYFQNLSIDTELQKFLPVFHFALYRTKAE